MQTHCERPRIGIVLGDHAGIGPEIVLKLLGRPRVYDLCRPVIIGNFELLCRTAQRINPDYLFVPYQPNEMDFILRAGFPESGI